MCSLKPADTDIATALANLDAMPDEVSCEFKDKRPDNYKDELDARFPSRDKAQQNHRGAKTTIVHFRGHKEIHKTAREAYVALMEQFIAKNSAPLTDLRVTGGRKDVRNNIASKKEHLFLQSPHLLDNQSNWRELKNGWYAITNLNATQNFKILCRYANACGLQHGKDWDFEPFDATEETSDARRREQLNQEMMDKVFADLDAME
jgi:3-dehydroquinate dehydratase